MLSVPSCLEKQTSEMFKICGARCTYDCKVWNRLHMHKEKKKKGVHLQ